MPAKNAVEFDVQDAFGTLNTAPLTVTWRNENDNSLPPVYADYANTTALGNPFSVAAGTTKLTFYSPAGRYRLDVTDGTHAALRRNFYVGTARGLDVEDIQAMIDASL